jgi:hypothetical protein
VKSGESQYSVPTPEEGKALIYFVADGHLTSPFAVNGKWVGAVNGGRYFIVAIDPGEQHICATLQSFHLLRGPKVSVHSLKTESGGSYYFRTRMVGISSGFVLQLDQFVGFGRGKGGLSLGRRSALRIPKTEVPAICSCKYRWY